MIRVVIVGSMIVISALMILFSIIEHRRYKLPGYKRMILFSSLPELIEKYAEVDAPRVVMPDIARKIDRNFRTEEMSWPWAVRIYCPTQKGEVVIDFPLKNDRYSKDEYCLINQIVLFKKGKVGMIERQKLISRFIRMFP
jgi:hypothetical protein